MAFSDVVAGNEIIASELRDAILDTSYRVFKPAGADQSVSSATTGTTLVNDTHLSAPLTVANGTYIFVCKVRYSTPTAADIKLAFTGPSGSTVLFSGPTMDLTTTTAANFSESSGGVLTSGGTGGIAHVVLHGSITLSSTTGTLQFQFAQNTSNATNTTVASHSWLQVWRIT